MKRVSEIVADIPILGTSGDLSTLVKSLQYDSRQVSESDAFVAIRGGVVDGHRYIREAYEKGCRVFFVEEAPDLADVVVVQLADTRRGLPFLAKNFYERVSDQMKLIGITGTNGKTTTAYLIHSILQSAQWQAGLISTVEAVVGKKHIPSVHTTPESLDLAGMLAEMYRRGIKSAVMEVSSHALALNRVDGLNWAAAVFTNLGHDHLDFHGDMDSYFAEKRKLFERLRECDRAIINLDDPYGEALIESTNGDVLTYAFSNKAATVSVRSIHTLKEGMALELNVPSGVLRFTTSLIGKFNVYNILAAVTTALSLGVVEPQISRGLTTLKRVPGRCESYETNGGYKIVIDYAHAPEALERVLQAMLALRPRGLSVVFGCGGDRDREKRPKMGKIAENYADKIYLTNDNPRSEDPEEIIAEILSGIYNQDKVEVIPSREAAIIAALKNARKGEIVLLAGKGHETSQTFSDGKIHFDERDVIREWLI